MKSKALEANLARIDLKIDPKYSVIEEIMSDFYGIKKEIESFLKELSHPHRNLHFIVQEVRAYCLNYFYVIKGHPKGAEGCLLFIDILMQAMESDTASEDAADTLLMFLKKILKESGPNLEKFIPVINEVFCLIEKLDDRLFFLFVKSFYKIKKLALTMIESGIVADFGPTCKILVRYLKSGFSYWLSEPDPLTRFLDETCPQTKISEYNLIFKDISHTSIKQQEQELNKIISNYGIDSKQSAQKLTRLYCFGDFAEIYRKIPDKIAETAGNKWKIIFLFHIMNISGLSAIHEETLRDINNTVRTLIFSLDFNAIKKLLEKTFLLLKKGEFPCTALDCILNIGKGVYETEDDRLIDLFIDMAVGIGFQIPKVHGVGDDWRVKVNPAHIQNIRTWLKLAQLKPQKSVKLISSLIIYLSLTGVFIRDTDLFARDITEFLNSNIRPVYHISKQLARLFPVYFNDIGAEGKIRDTSTKIDEINSRKDRLIHFLRKQSHIESSELVVGFIEAIIIFWETGDKKLVKKFVPADIYESIKTKGPFIDGEKKIISHLKKEGLKMPGSLLDVDESRLKEMIQGIADEISQERVVLISTFYKLLYQKYRLGFAEIRNYLEQAADVPEIDRILVALKIENVKIKIGEMLEILNSYKELILSDKKYKAKEDIYKKRHIAVDIPSMYGSYHETKFNTLGADFRIESIINVLFERLVSKIDLSLVTKSTFFEIYPVLKLFVKALQIDGISSFELERQIELLDRSLNIKGFSITQYIDIFKGLSKCVKNIIEDNFKAVHSKNLAEVISKIDIDDLLDKYRPRLGPRDKKRMNYVISEIFFRDLIALSPGLQQLDIFLTKILSTLFEQIDKLPDERLRELLLYDIKKVAASIDKTPKIIYDSIYLGNKGCNLVKLKEMNFPIPHGFIITTESFRWRTLINSYQPAKQNFENQVKREMAKLEANTGKKLGSPQNPLLLSIRSGSTISQPGMMDTFLNVGINEEIAESIAQKTKNPWFAWDNYRRFLQCYGMAFEIERNEFDAIIQGYKLEKKVALKKELTGDDMKEIALAYKKRIQEAGVEIIEDMFELLFLTIRLVFSSWGSDKAKNYRKIMGISNDWGTAATIQEMVFGNVSEKSGTGVIFTRNPQEPNCPVNLWGDYSIGNQGEDVVAGLVNTIPISYQQLDAENRDSKEDCLEKCFPKIYKTLYNIASELTENRGWPPQEMEFTFEGQKPENLYILQTRDMTIRKTSNHPTFDMDEKIDPQVIGKGVGASGGAMSGRIVFSIEEIEKWKKLDSDRSLILIRNDTVPDDIREINAADGLLTAKGGVTSHAAVAAHSLNKTCVVGCGVLICDERKKECIIGRYRLKSGDYISIDGREGSIYLGKREVKKII